MKRYVDGKIIDTPKEAEERVRRYLKKRRVALKAPEDYEAKIKILEESLNKVLEQLQAEQNNKDVQV